MMDNNFIGNTIELDEEYTTLIVLPFILLMGRLSGLILAEEIFEQRAKRYEYPIS